MRLALVHARYGALELLRYPSFSVPTLALPAIFFVFFGIPRAHGRADVLLASFAAYAVLSVAFFQFGVAIAIERSRPWETYVRTLPAGAGTRMTARLISASLFALLAVGAVIAVALPATSPHLAAAAWVRLGLALVVGSVPFTLLGVALGYWLPAKGALPVANILYLTLSYAGGLWTGPTGLPKAISRISEALPTRQWADVLWAAARGEPFVVAHWVWLGVYAVVFGGFATWGYQRDEGQRFR